MPHLLMDIQNTADGSLASEKGTSSASDKMAEDTKHPVAEPKKKPKTLLNFFSKVSTPSDKTKSSDAASESKKQQEKGKEDRIPKPEKTSKKRKLDVADLNSSTEDFDCSKKTKTAKRKQHIEPKEKSDNKQSCQKPQEKTDKEEVKEDAAEKTVSVSYEDFLKSFGSKDAVDTEVTKDACKDGNTSCEIVDDSPVSVSHDKNENVKDTTTCSDGENISSEDYKIQDPACTKNETTKSTETESPEKKIWGKLKQPKKCSIEVSDDNGAEESSTDLPKEPVKPKFSIARFFNKGKSSSAEEANTQVTIKADIHPEPSPPKDVVCKTKPAKEENQKSKAGGKKRKKSNAVIESADCDWTITHLGTVEASPVKEPFRRASRLKHDEDEDLELEANADVASDCVLDEPVDSFTDAPKTVEECVVSEPQRQLEKKAEESTKPDREASSPGSSSDDLVITSVVLSPKKLASEAALDRKKQIAENFSKMDIVKMPSGKKTAQCTLDFGSKKGFVLKKKSPEDSPVKSENKSTKRTKQTNKKSSDSVESEELSETPRKSRVRRKLADKDKKQDTSDSSDVFSPEPIVYKAKLMAKKKAPGTPIRMKFTRISKRTADKENLKKLQTKMQQAQKLIQKAKTGQKGKMKEATSKQNSGKNKGGKKGKKQKEDQPEDQDCPRRKRSSRHSAVVASAAITEVYEPVQTPVKSKGKGKQKLVQEEVDESTVLSPRRTRKKNKQAEDDVEVCKTPKRGKAAATPKKRTATPKKTAKKTPSKVKLASIFKKKSRTESSDSDDVKITKVDLEAVQRRKDFLLSGVPEALITLKNTPDEVVELSDYMPFPLVSHVQQIPGTYTVQPSEAASLPDCSVLENKDTVSEDLASSEKDNVTEGNDEMQADKTADAGMIVEESSDTGATKPEIAKENAEVHEDESRQCVEGEEEDIEVDEPTEQKQEASVEDNREEMKIAAKQTVLKLMVNLRDRYQHPHVFSTPKTCDPWTLNEVDLQCKNAESFPQCTSYCVSDVINKCCWKIRQPFCTTAPQKLNDEIENWLLAEASLANPAFPVRRMYKRLEKKNLQSKPVKPEEKNVEEKQDADAKCKKRKHGEAPVRQSKRRKRQRESTEVVIIEEQPVSEKTDETNTEPQDSGEPKLLWTEKYAPGHSTDIVGNTNSVKRLKTWLLDWKQQTSLEIKRLKREIMKQAKRTKKTKEEIMKKLGCNWLDDDSDFDYETEDEDSDFPEDDILCNTMLITGPHGIGKTSTVHALAQELGYKVFEVNSSSKRVGKQILAQLQEATQSHQVSKKHLDTVMSSLTPQKKHPEPKKKKVPTATLR